MMTSYEYRIQVSIEVEDYDKPIPREELRDYANVILPQLSVRCTHAGEPRVVRIGVLKPDMKERYNG